MKKLILFFAAWLALFVPVLAAAPAQQVAIACQVVQGLQSVYPNVLFQYQEPGTTTAQFGSSTVVSIPANSTNNTINTATLFPGCVTPVAVGIAEITSPGLPLSLGLSNGGPRLNLAAGGWNVTRVVSGFPTFYVDNASPSTAALVQVFILSN